jgi:hypothetical protein
LTGRSFRTIKPLLAFDQEALQLVGQGGRDQAGRHSAVEGNRRAQRGAHRREAGPLEEAAPAALGDPSEDQPVGSLGILGVELAKPAFAAFGHP